MKRIKRTKDFEIILTINNNDFINPPKISQRNALVNNTIKEFAENLKAYNELSQFFVAGDLQIDMEDRTQKILNDDEIMEDWQMPIMQSMANIVTASKGDVLEIGFGLGCASDMIQEKKIKSHTIIECNDSVIDRYNIWKTKYVDRNITMIHGLWQDKISALGLFDGIFFHTYTLNEEEYLKYVNGATTFAEHFFPMHLHI